MLRKSYINQLEGLRGLAAIWVILFHYTWFLNISKNIIKFHFISIFLEKGYLGVDIFFILSGYIVSYKYFESISNVSSYLNFLKNRFARIYPSYLLNLIIVFILFITHNLTPFVSNFGTYTVETFILNLLLLQCWIFNKATWGWNIPSWTVSVELFLYLIFPAVIFILKFIKKSYNLFFLALLLYIVLILIIHNDSQFFIMDAMKLGIIRGIIEFYIGSIGYRIMYFKKININKYCTLVIWFFFIISIYINNIYISILSLIFMIPCMSVSYGLIEKFFSSNIMRYFGKISYTMYISQFIFQLFENNLLTDNMFHNNQILNSGLFGAVLISLLIFSSLVFKFIENPLRIKIKLAKFKRVKF